MPRVVSLVPSLTEAVAASAPGVLVGATAWCTHPAGLAVQRIGGTKNPDLSAIRALAPDLIVANEEENRAADLDALRDAGLTVLLTRIGTVDEAFAELDRLLDALDRLLDGGDAPATDRAWLDRAWLDRARRAWSFDPPVTRTRVVVPIWRRPWMFVGSGTYAGDVLARLGYDNVLAADPQRYPRHDPDALPAHDLVVLPDEPYRFTPTDGPQSFTAASRFVDGRFLTWYGPAMIDAPSHLRAALSADTRSAP